MCQEFFVVFFFHFSITTGHDLSIRLLDNFSGNLSKSSLLLAD